jgi:hypothetical protein
MFWGLFSAPKLSVVLIQKTKVVLFIGNLTLKAKTLTFLLTWSQIFNVLPS